MFLHLPQRVPGTSAWRAAQRRRLAFSLPIALVLVSLLAAPVRAATCTPLPPYATEADRVGINVITDYGKSIFDYNVVAFTAGWYIDYRPEALFSAVLPPTAASQADAAVMLPLVASVDSQALIQHSMAHMPVLRLSDLEGDWHDYVGSLIDRHPGSLWAIGNEQDRDLQDGRTPAQYAVIYHDVYHFIKQRDPTSRIAIGAVVLPTPLRRHYLDLVLNEYRRRYGAQMPVDVWNIHAFILRENDEWGAGVPPGMEAYAHEGILYDVPDHGNLEILKQWMRDFRQWMARHGYRDTPLIVSEYGILMPPDYDAGNGRVYDHAFVRDFMLGSFEFFRTAVDAQTGLAADGNRLVQAWSWFGLNNYVYSDPDRLDGFNGNLLEHDSGQITPLGQDFVQYTQRYDLDYVDLAVRRASASITSIPVGAAGTNVRLDVSLFNRGNLATQRARLRVWLGDPQAGGTLLGEQTIAGTLSPRCRSLADSQIQVTLPALAVGHYNLTVEAIHDGPARDAIAANDRAIIVLRVGEDADFSRVFLPLLKK